MTAVEVWVNGGKVNAEDQVLSAPDDGRVGVLRLKLPPQDATVSLKAYNNNGASEPAQLQITWLGAGAVAKPKFYVLAVESASMKRRRTLISNLPTRTPRISSTRPRRRRAAFIRMLLSNCFATTTLAKTLFR